MPPNGQFSSLIFFVCKCGKDVEKLQFNKTLKFSNLSKEKRIPLKNLKQRKNVIKAAD